MSDPLSCPHGYESGPRGCPMCRRAMPAGVLVADPRHTDAILRAIDPEPTVELGFTSPLWTQFALPYRDPGDIAAWRRSNGTSTLTIRPATLHRPDGTIVDGYPFGVVPRLLLVWIATEVTRHGQREVYLGSSIARFMTTLGIARTGPSIRRLGDQVMRLIGCSITVTSAEETPIGAFQNFAGLMIGAEARLWWSKRDRADQDGLFESSIVLSEEYYRQILASAIPVDMAHLAALRASGGGGLPIDIYCWLSHRMSYLRAPSRLTWDQLAVQFGSQYTRPRAFKAEYLKALSKVLAVWPDFKVQQWDRGLILSRSKTPVSPRALPR